MDGRHVRQVLRRAARLRCPVCGNGRLFDGWNAHAHCPSCGFLLEREPGYWTNAVTLNYMLTGGLASMLVAPLVMLTGWPIPVLLAVGLSTAVGLSLGCYWHMKALWVATDLLIRPPDMFEQLSGFLRTEKIRVPVHDDAA